MSTEGPPMTLSTQAVLRTLVSEPGRDRFGLELSAETGLPVGPLHPILARLEGLGWVESSWESIDPQQAGRPRRRAYRMTSNGLESARTALALSHAKRVRIATRLTPIGETS